MATMNISLPIRQDQLRAEKEALLQQAITIGLESAEAGPLDMLSIKRQARAKAGLK